MRSLFCGPSNRSPEEFQSPAIQGIWKSTISWLFAISIVISMYMFEFMRIASWAMSFVVILLITSYVRLSRFLNSYDQDGPIYLWKRIVFWTAFGICLIGVAAVVCVNFNVAAGLMMNVGIICLLIQGIAATLIIITPDRKGDCEPGQRWKYGIRRGLFIGILILIGILSCIWIGYVALYEYVNNFFAIPVL